MRRLFVTSATLLIALICIHSFTVKAGIQGQRNEPVIPIEGLDPVMLAQGKEVQGDMKISVTRGQFQYLFANQENKALFEKDPARYEIQLEGHCARMGPPVGGNADLFTVYKGRIFVFGSEACKERFVSAPESYIESESTQPVKSPASTESIKRGQALIEKAVEAVGGASRLDAISTYREKSKRMQSRGAADVEVHTDMLIAFPDRARFETTMPDFRDKSVTRKDVVVIAPSQSFAVSPRGVMPMSNASRAEQEKEINRNIILILRARKSKEFSASSVGDAKVGSAAVEQVAVQVSDTSYILGIDPATGRILTLSFRKRGPQGDFGQVVQAFSDFRVVDGLTLPFKIESTFNGEPWNAVSRTIESISINGQADQSLFEKPRSSM